MSSQRNPWSSSDDYLFFSLIAIVLGSIALSWMVWSTWHGPIAAFYIKAMLLQLRVLNWGNPALTQLQQQLAMAANWPDHVRAVQLYYGLAIIGHAYRWPAAILIACAGGLCMWRAAPGRFSKALDLEGLIAVQARMFPTLQGFAKRRLTTLVAPAKGLPLPADPSLHASEWRARFATDRAGQFSAAGAERALAAQLGRHWTGPASASAIERVLLAAFMLHHDQRRPEAMALLGDLSGALAESGLDGPTGPATPLRVPATVLAKAQDILAEAGIAARLTSLCLRNGWTVTALMTVLTEARRCSGVLAPPAFAIIKLIDRSLWYALHSLGFPAERPEEDIHPNPRIEAAGARAHWEAERRAGRPIYTAAIDPALNAIRPAKTS